RLVGERVGLLVFLERLFVIPLADQDVPPAQLIVIGVLLVLLGGDGGRERREKDTKEDEGYEGAYCPRLDPLFHLGASRHVHSPSWLLRGLRLPSYPS